MKILRELYEGADSEQIFLVRVRGNFYGGKYYETGLDSIFVLAGSDKEAVAIAKKNIASVEKHFRNKKYANGKKAISRNDKKRFKADDIADAKVTKQKEHNKVLKADGSVGPASIKA